MSAPRARRRLEGAPLNNMSFVREKFGPAAAEFSRPYYCWAGGSGVGVCSAGVGFGFGFLTGGFG
jgi:hypothetical protein